MYIIWRCVIAKKVDKGKYKQEKKRRGRKPGTEREKFKNSAIRALRRAFSRSDLAKRIKDKAIIPNLRGIRGGKLCKCYYCGDPIEYYKAQVDHIDDVVKIELSQLSMTLNLYFQRLFCDESNLVCTCPDCHKKKSKETMLERTKWRKKKKYLICRLRGGCLVKVIPMVDLKDPELYQWEILDVGRTRQEADCKAKKIRGKKPK